MEYIWETIGEKPEKYFFKQAKEFGPYSEIISVEPVDSESGKRVVEYNSLYRFDRIFADMLALEKSEGEWTEYFFDACTHLLMQVEGLEGLDRREIRIRHLMYRIEHGLCLNAIREQYHNLTREQQYQIASYYILQEQLGESIYLYAQAVTRVLKTGVVYKCTLSPKELLVYLGEALTEERKQLWNILNYCFLPISYQVRLFEKTHFAILNEEQTMEYERLELF